MFVMDHNAFLPLVAQPTICNSSSRLSFLEGKLGVLIFLQLGSLDLSVPWEIVVMPILRPWKYWILQSPRFHLILLTVVVEAAVRRNIWELWCLDWMPPHFTACELLLKSSKVDLVKSGGRISVNTYSACFVQGLVHIVLRGG
jgi:hypothetical protein